jgi:hypothetical protein
MHPHRAFALAPFCALLLAAGCASRPVPRVERLGDGVFRSPTEQEAEAYCRNFGAPMRFITDERKDALKDGFMYRCD